MKRFDSIHCRLISDALGKLSLTYLSRIAHLWFSNVSQKILSVQRGAWKLPGKNKTSAALSWVERAHLSTRSIQRQVIQLLRFIQPREEKKSIHTPWMLLKCVSLQLTVIWMNNREKGCVLIHFRPCQSLFTPLLVPHSLRDTHVKQGEPWLVWFFK